MMHLRNVLLLAVISIAGSFAPAAAAAESISVNAATKYQTMTGWEALARSWEIDKVNNTYDPSWRIHAPAVADRMVNELGINRIAIGINSGWANPVDYWTQFVNHQLTYTEWGALNYNAVDPNSHQFAEFDFYADTVLMPMKAAMAAKGETLYVNMVFGDSDKAAGNTYKFSQNPAAYAGFVQFYVDRLKTKYGIVIDAFSIINEPDRTAGWRGVEIGKALVAVKSRLDAAGYPNINYTAPSVADAPNMLPYLKAIESVPGAMAVLKTLSYHRYTGADYAAIHAFAQTRGKQTAMTEYFPATIDTIFDDLLRGQVSNWQKWSTAGKKGGSLNGYYVADLSNPAAPVFSFAPNVAHMALVFRYVRLGAIRVDATSATMKTVAFVNPSGTNVVVVKRTAGSGSAPVTITGLKPGTYGVRAIVAGTTQATDLPDLVVAANGSMTVTLPEAYTTVYGKSSAASAIVLVEYHHAAWDHYFLTGDPGEITKLDNGTFEGWVRTGRTFNAYPAGDPLGTSVCRFFSTSFAPRSSHFYTPFANECTIVSGNPDWSWEGVVFSIGVPDSGGMCPAGTVLVYRLYNNGQGAAPNHRYTTSADVRAQMIGQGWIPEGYGPVGVTMCSPE